MFAERKRRRTSWNFLYAVRRRLASTQCADRDGEYEPFQESFNERLFCFVRGEKTGFERFVTILFNRKVFNGKRSYLYR